MTNKNTLIISLAFLMLPLCLQAQETLDASGGEASGTGGTVSYSLGQIAYLTKGASFTIAEGVQQPAEISMIPLPVELLRFEAKVVGNRKVDLFWTTTMEVNNDYFTVERSRNGEDWEFVARVEAAGNSEETLDYQTRDENPYLGISYYRLKQTDYDGTYAYSQKEVVRIEGRNSIKVFPNPTSGTLTLSTGEIPVPGMAYELFDVAGKRLKADSITQSETQMEMGDLPAGTYMLRVLEGNAVMEILKVIKSN